jgi:voltage-gated potassium channel
MRRLGTAVLEALQPVIILAALITIPLTAVEINGQNGTSFQVADWAIWSLFLFEYVLGLALATERSGYIVRSWVGLIVVLVSFPLLPTIFAAIRLARLARLFRLARLVAFASRALPALKSTLGRTGLIYLVGVFVLLIAVAGAVMSVAEPQTVKGNLWDGMWWAVVTATTVGYGDISPSSPIGRLIAVALMLLGIGLTATLAASVAAYFVGQDTEDAGSEVLTRLERVEQLLLELKGRRSTE